MSTATKDTTNNVWSITTDLGTIGTSDVSKTINIATAGTYVDQNIQITATAKTPGTAKLGASATGSATISSVTVGTKSDSNYPITGSASISGTASASTTTSGIATAGSTTGSGSTSGTANLSATIPAAAATVSMSATAASPTVAIDASNDNILADAATTTKPSSGYYAAVKATAPATTLSGTPSVTTAGYLGAAAEITASAKTSSKTGADYYVPITAGQIGVSSYNTNDTSVNSATDLSGYTENTSAVVPTAGSLTLTEGYYPKTFIQLKTLVPNEATIANTTAGAATIRTGTTAYDKDGSLITGTMGNASVKSGDVTATAVSATYNSTNANYDVTVTASAAAPTVVSGGYIDSSTGTKTSNSSVTSTATLAKVALTAAKSSGNLTVAPTLARTAKPSADTWTDAASGAATTTKPTSGPYVQIDAAAATNTLKVKPQVGTAGYGDTTNYGYTEYSASVGAAKATTRYIPITTGSASVTGNSSLTINAGDPTLNSSTGKYDISLTVPSTAISASVSTAGWISSVTSANVSGSATKSLAAAALTHGNTATETSVAVSASGSRSSNLAAPGSDTTYYVTVSASQTAAGSVTHAASVSTGFVPSAGLSADATIPTSASITGNGTKVYLKSTAITGSVASTFSDTSYDATGVLTSAPSSGAYIDFAGNGSATSGAVYTGSATAAHKYVKIYDGAYTES